MNKDDRSAINPFTGKSHLDLINDDEFLVQCEKEYNNLIRTKKLKDNDKEGIIINDVALKLINAVEKYLADIGRSDYTDNYYDWEFHVVDENILNAFCMPGGKIVFFAGMFNIINTVDEIAFILAHEMAHALLDHSRTQLSAQNVKNGLTSIAKIGSLGLALVGLEEMAVLTRTLTNIADIGSEFFIMKPFGRNQEIEADKLGMYIVHLAGYDINAMPEFWQRFSEISSNNHDFFSSHPADSKRIEAMREVIRDIDNGIDFLNNPILGDDKAVDSNRSIACENCGNPLNINDNFCINCGIEIKPDISNKDIGDSLESNLVSCPNCGGKIEKSNKFCIHCGFELDSSTSDGNVNNSSEYNSVSCPNCGEKVEENNKFCIHCGFKLNSDSSEDIMNDYLEDSISDLVSCPNCGKDIAEDTNFCIHCGYQLKKETTLKENHLANIENTCSNCGNEVDRDDLFCNECGTNLNNEVLVCSDCGGNISIEDKFCIHCGKKINR